ncbi:MAG: FkbM family methyltransferase [Deltaproteobacteria bacterium]|nr:FkbM family methyltransferase [Deltaproteobacteria bacterium]
MIQKVLLWYARAFPQHRGKNKLIRVIDRFRRDKGAQEVRQDDIIWWLDTTDHIQWHIFYYGVYEKEETRWIEQTLKPGMVSFDVGANIGYYTVKMSRLVGENGRVYAFEATSTAYNVLKKHVHLNRCNNVTFNHLAVSNRNGHHIIYCAHNANTGQSSLLDFDGAAREEDVQCITLDSYIKENNIDKIDFIKIDVEGAEMLVLEGSVLLLQQFRPTIMIEINPMSLSRMGTSAHDLIAKIIQAGYSINSFNKGILEPCHDWFSVLKGKENENFIFKPEMQVQ